MTEVELTARYRAAVEALRAETADGLDGARLDAVFKRIATQMPAPDESAMRLVRGDGDEPRLDVVYGRVTAALDVEPAVRWAPRLALAGLSVVFAAAVHSVVPTSALGLGTSLIRSARKVMRRSRASW